MDTNSLQTKTLVFGILSLALSESVICGLIFGILAVKNAKTLTDANALSGKAKVGKILGTVGLILAIVALVAWISCIACSGAAACAGGMSNY